MSESPIKEKFVLPGELEGLLLSSRFGPASIAAALQDALEKARDAGEFAVLAIAAIREIRAECEASLARLEEFRPARPDALLLALWDSPGLEAFREMSLAEKLRLCDLVAARPALRERPASGTKEVA